MDAIVPFEGGMPRILFVRGRRVMLDSDLAVMYGVETKAVNRAVRRNLGRFPADFLFQLTREEVDNLRYQIGTSSSAWGGRRSLPFVFTEHGAVMLASVLNSSDAIEASVYVVRAFLRLREVLAGHRALARKIAEMEKKYDAKFKVVFDAIHKFLTEPLPPRGRIGFRREDPGETGGAPGPTALPPGSKDRSPGAKKQPKSK